MSTTRCLPMLPFATVLLAAVAATATRADDGNGPRYRLRFDGAPVATGLPVEESLFTETFVEVDLVTPEGPVPAVEILTQRSLAFRREILEVEDGRAVRERRSFSRATCRTHEGREQLGFAGKTVTADRLGDAWVFRCDDGTELSGDDVERLRRLFGEEALSDATRATILGPGRPVAVGERWSPAIGPFAERILGLASDAVDLDGAVGELELLDVEEREGGAIGHIVGLLRLPIRKLGELALAEPVLARVEVRFEIPLDDSTASGGALDVNLRIAATEVGLADGSGRSIRPRVSARVHRGTARR